MDNAEFRRQLALAEAGNSSVQAGLGGQLLYGLGLPVDYPLAHRLLTMAHRRGVPAAAVCLGDMYLNGWGVESDPVRAAALYEEAAQSGHWPSLIELGRLFRLGAGPLPSDSQRAVSYYARAVETAEEAGWNESEEMEEAVEYLAAAVDHD